MGHSHSHNHSHGHAHGATDQTSRAFLWAISLNLLFTITEAGYAIAAHSMSLLADAGHNLGDVLGLVFSFAANWLLTKPATDRYSYGYKKTTILAALANVLLLGLASGIIAYEAILHLLHPTPVAEKLIIIVAFIGILVNGGTALLFIKGSKEDLNVKGAFIHLAGDALIALGVVITGILLYFTHWLWLDPLVGLIIVLAILIGSWQLAKDSVNLVLDAVPQHIDQKAVSEYLKSIAGVAQVHDLHIWGLSTRETALTAHLIMPNVELTDTQIHDINHHLKHDFRIDHVTLQIEKSDKVCDRTESC